MNYRRFFPLLIALFVFTYVAPRQVNAQDETSVYFSKKVVDSNGDPVNHEIPTVLFTVFLNGEQDSLLIENAPRWDGGDSNYDAGNNLVGIELQNFTHFSSGDSVHLRFTDRTLEERGSITQEIDTIPWSDPNPFANIQLEQISLPERPQNVELTVSDNHERTLTWDAKSGLTYDVYRRSRLDTIFNGDSRNLYTRVAADLNSGSYTDSNTDADKNFGYIVYAKNSSGVRSVHSPDVFDQNKLTGLQVSNTTARNVTLSWNAYEPFLNKLAGYNIYRRKEGESFRDQPLAYTGTETKYTDTRLEPGVTYYYKVIARNYDMGEMGAPGEVQATTESSTDGYMTYANLKTAVVIYKHTPFVRGGDYQMSDAVEEDVKFLLERMREYYWRNTKMQLNLEFDYIVFEEYKELTDASATSTRETGTHLEEDRGVVNTQYDMVFRITAAVGGFWSWGATNLLELPGPDRRTGFSQVRFPYRDFVIDGFPRYPIVYDEIDYQNVGNNLIWTATHENQHSIDGVYNHNGHPEMGHGDFPQLYAKNKIENSDIGCCYPGFPEYYSKKFGRRFSFQSTMMRDFKAYKDLKSNWGDIYEAKDADGDGMPDDDPRVPLDEERFGSSSTEADADGDGYNDKQEAIDGIFQFSYSDPQDPDSDGDGIIDGKDKYPRYPMDTRIKTTAQGFVPDIDGDVSEWPEHTLVVDTVSKVERNQSFAPKVYMAYSSDSLYVALDLPDHAQPYIRWDFDNNGRWYGSGNTVMDIDVNEGRFDELRTWDASEASRDLEEQNNNKKEGIGKGYWDDSRPYLQEFGGPVVNPGSVNLSVGQSGGGPTIEMAIPRNEDANLPLNEGDTLGFHINYTDVMGLNLGAHTFDWWSYAYVNLSGLKATDVPSEDEIAKGFKLNQNYPNPFNPATTIQYSLAQSSDVELKVYDMLGREVATLVNDQQNAGQHSVKFNASNLSSGVYFYRLTAGQKSRIRKMTLIK